MKKPNKQPNNKNLNGGRWGKGESGNPKGRPPKIRYLSELLEEEGKRIPTIEQDGFDGHGLKNDILLARALYRKARNGDPKAIEIILERREGKVTLPIGGDEQNPIFVTLLSKLRGNGSTDER